MVKYTKRRLSIQKKKTLRRILQHGGMPWDFKIGDCVKLNGPDFKPTIDYGDDPSVGTKPGVLGLQNLNKVGKVVKQSGNYIRVSIGGKESTYFWQKLEKANDCSKLSEEPYMSPSTASVPPKANGRGSATPTVSTVPLSSRGVGNSESLGATTAAQGRNDNRTSTKPTPGRPAGPSASASSTPAPGRPAGPGATTSATPAPGRPAGPSASATPGAQTGQSSTPRGQPQATPAAGNSMLSRYGPGAAAATAGIGAVTYVASRLFGGPSATELAVAKNKERQRARELEKAKAAQAAASAAVAQAAPAAEAAPAEAPAAAPAAPAEAPAAPAEAPAAPAEAETEVADFKKFCRNLTRKEIDKIARDCAAAARVVAEEAKSKNIKKKHVGQDIGKLVFATMASHFKENFIREEPELNSNTESNNESTSNNNGSSSGSNSNSE
jgi:hypothetical protein